MISIIDDRGELIATLDPRRNLQTVLDELPGADQALRATRPHSWVRGRWPGLAFQRRSRPVCRLGRCRAEACRLCATSTDGERTE